MLAIVKAKKCKGCGASFTPARPLARACSVLCALKIGRAKTEKANAAKAKQEKAKDKAKREKLKSRAKWLAECQAIVNKIVRIRDVHLGCCSCDRGPSWDGQWHASHLRSVGAASAVRFNLWNINKACSICNNHLSGNVAEYLPRIRARIGDAKVDWLYTQNQLVKHDIPYLTRFKAVMGKKLRRLEKRVSL